MSNKPPVVLSMKVVLMKVPTVGGLVHFLTIEAFRKALPKGAMNFITGRGRETMPVLMETGKIDGLAFIGGSNAADRLIKQHPHPHRLKLFLQLEAKNMGIFLPDILEKPDEFSKAIDQAVLGGTSNPVLFLCRNTTQNLSTCFSSLRSRINYALVIFLPKLNLYRAFSYTRSSSLLVEPVCKCLI